jgi:PAS domain S-box-containing protein
MKPAATKILLVEDNPGDAHLIREMLRKADHDSFEIEWVPRLAPALERLAQGEIDLVLLDLGLPDSQGLDTFVQAYSQAPGVPFVVLTGLADETLALTAVRRGAQDYLLKGETDGNLLLRAIRYATERKKIEEALRQAHDELEHRVQERTAELVQTNAQLREAERALQLSHDKLELKVALRTAELAKVNLELLQEIEERRRAEEGREAERRRLYTLLDTLPAFVYLKAPDYSIRFANQGFRSRFGDPGDQLCYQALLGRSEPCDGCNSLEVLETGTPLTAEWTLRLNSEARTYQLHHYPFMDTDGSPLVLTLGIDVTQRKQVEQRLRESEEQYRLLVSQIPAMVFRGYADWSIDFFDDKIRELTGYEKEEFDSRRMKWSDLIVEEDFEGAKQAFLRSFKRDRTYAREYRIRDKQGKILWIQARGQIFCAPDGKIDHISGVLFDITERRQAEERLQESEKNLRYLASRLLTAQERERKRISRELHDELGQALLVLKLQMRSLERKLAPSSRDLRQDCKDFLSSLDHLVDSVRRLSRDLSPSILEDLGLSAALQHLIDEFNKHYHISEHLTDLDEIDDLFPPEAQINIYRIFQEGLTNIGKYAEATRIKAVAKRGADRVSFLLEDNGQGFEVAQVLAADPTGKGLGLAAMEERVRMLGGSLRIESRAGAGTRISFTVPFSRKANPPMLH